MSRILTQQNRREGKRFVKFLVVGGIGFVVDAVTFSIFAHYLHLRELVAQAFSFIAALISNFTWNRYWTYPDSRSKSMRRQLVQFALVNAIGLGIRTVVFALVHPPYLRLAARLTLIPMAPDKLGDFLSLATSVLVVLLWNFVVNRYWTYNDVD